MRPRALALLLSGCASIGGQGDAPLDGGLGNHIVFDDLARLPLTDGPAAPTDGPTDWAVSGDSLADGPAADDLVADDLAAGGDLAAGDAGVLDPGLALPDPHGAVCMTPGSLGECATTQVCRFFTPTDGRCESCTTCNNLHAACVKSSDCDILFSCYQGVCTNFCKLGSTECGAPQDCLAVGNAIYGVCRVH